MLRLIIVIVAIALMLSSCDKCKLKQQYTVNISGNNAVVNVSGDLWSDYQPAELRDGIINSLRFAFKHPKELIVTDSTADYYVIIDSVRTTSGASTQSVTDPCAKNHSWLYNSLFPPQIYTYTLRNSRLTVYFTIKDSVNNKSSAIEEDLYNAETLVLNTPADSTACKQYVIQGDVSTSDNMNAAAEQSYCDLKCKIHDWVK